MKIYPSLGCYVLKVENLYYDAISMNKLDTYVASESPEFYASCNSSPKYTNVTRDVQYLRGYLHQYEIPNFKFNYYYAGTDITNYCANVAGLTAINYWNKKYDNDLIKTDALLDGNLSYPIKDEIIHTFYDYMNTNWFFGIGGTLPKDCYNGFERFVKEHGYQVERKTNLDYNDIILSIIDGIPIFITSNDYYYASSLPTPSSENGDNVLSITYKRYSGIGQSHTFIGYGYAFYSMYDPNGKGIREELIEVSTGWGDRTYFNFSVSNRYSIAAINVFKE